MSNHATYYTANFADWQGKQLGAKPTIAQLATAHAFGRPGKQSLALAMALRDAGVSASQIIMACGAPQLNHMRGLITEGHFKREAAAANDVGHTVYKLTLTKKGEAAMAKREAAAAEAKLEGDKPKATKVKLEPKGDKPAKVKASKPRKAKADKVPVVPAQAVTEQAVAEQPAA